MTLAVSVWSLVGAPFFSSYIGVTEFDFCRSKCDTYCDTNCDTKTVSLFAKLLKNNDSACASNLATRSKVSLNPRLNAQHAQAWLVHGYFARCYDLSLHHHKASEQVRSKSVFSLRGCFGGAGGVFVCRFLVASCGFAVMRAAISFLAVSCFATV